MGPKSWQLHFRSCPKAHCALWVYFSFMVLHLWSYSHKGQTWSCSDTRDDGTDTRMSGKEQCDGSRRWIIFWSENCVQRRQFIMSYHHWNYLPAACQPIRSFASVVSLVLFKQMKYACFSLCLWIFCTCFSKRMCFNNFMYFIDSHR